MLLIATWLALPLFWAILFSVALPYTGYYALLYGDRFQTAILRAKTFLYFLFHRSEQTRLAREGSQIIARIRELGRRVELDRDQTGNQAALDESPHFAMTVSEFEREFRDDCASLRQLLAGLDRLQHTWDGARLTIHAQERGYFTPDEDDLVRQCLLSYRNHRLALYEIILRYVDYQQVADRSEQLRGFMAGYAAALALHARSLSIIQAYHRDPLVRDKINEPDAKFDLIAGFFDQTLRAYTSPYNYRRLARSGRFWLTNRRRVRELGLDDDADCRWLCDVIRNGRSAVRRGFWNVTLQRLRYDRQALTRSLRRPLHRVRYGLQTILGGTFAKVRTTTRYRPALDAHTIEQVSNSLKSGDVLLVRSERKVTTALLPGFWAHAAIYIAGREDLERMGLDRHPYVRKHLSAMPAQGERFGYVLEALSSGVAINPLERCLIADHVVALRPCLADDELLSAITEAFGHLGKPYDFEFDFNVTTRLVCTELIYRSYHGRGAIDFPLVKRLGRYTLSGDDILGWFLGRVRGAGDPSRPALPKGTRARRADGRSRSCCSSCRIAKSGPRSFRRRMQSRCCAPFKTAFAPTPRRFPSKINPGRPTGPRRLHQPNRSNLEKERSHDSRHLFRSTGSRVRLAGRRQGKQPARSDCRRFPRAPRLYRDVGCVRRLSCKRRLVGAGTGRLRL